MKYRNYLYGVGAAAAMLILILDAKTALSGAADGIELCITTVIPALFPFILFSGMLTSSITGTSGTLFRPLGILCGIPPGAEPLFLAGLIGGYPTGARMIAEAYRKNLICREDAERMLGFSNNAGPAFIFGMAGYLFPDRTSQWALWLVHIGGAVLTAAVLPRTKSKHTAIPSGDKISLAQALSSGVRTMGLICGWVVIFRIGIAFSEKWFLWLLPEIGQILFMGLAELTNGCIALTEVNNDYLKFILLTIILAFGGLCVTMQTCSVSEGISMKMYIPGKGIHCLMSLVLALAYLGWAKGNGYVGMIMLVPLGYAAAAFVFRKNKKTVAFP